MHYIPLYSLRVIHNIFSSYHDSRNLSNNALISRRFLGKLVNQYWQETIFLSISNSLSEKYINQLKLEGVLICKNEQKKFLLDFSKALLAGRIETSLDFNKTGQHYDESIKYIWKKGFNFPLPNKFRPLFQKNNNKLSKEQVILLNKLQNQPLPLFTVTNNLNQIILAKSLEETNYNLNLIDKIYKWYYHKFIFNQQVHAVYHGLFFIQPIEAIEYLNSIKNNYNISNKENEVKLFSTQLATYYKFTKMNVKSLEFRLIPDLNEISQLLYKYKSYKNLKFDKDQKYGKNFFQGQPIYIIKPFWAFNKETHKMELLEYNYRSDINSKSKIVQNTVIFTSYQTALKAWQKFSQESINYKISRKPQILVSNLEDLIKKYEYSQEINKHNILFMPNIESYKFIKKDESNKPQSTINQIFVNKFVYFKILTQKIIWSLTSRQPINW
uniref:Uncharacterized protein n=1 Tax=Gracilariopsis heteroclada TaxID=172978 RepID=A0A344V688_9FLOR|nr:hypothetical protein [Gracilariopsis heteroclada]AXE43475.1 hypothetical protein [Gracilariopsis heteroclada]